MKHLILSLLACLFLCTACFEKEEIEKEEETVEVAPPEVDILECEVTQKFIDYIESDSVRSPRSTIKKYSKGTETIYEINDGGNLPMKAPSVVSYHYTSCEFICSDASGIVQGQYCSEDFFDSLVYVETVWKDER